MQWIGHSKIFWTLTFEPLGRNMGPLYFRTHRVVETALRASWFLASLARFPGTWGIFSTPGDSKLTPDGPGLQWNGHSKTLWTFGFEFLGWKIPSLFFQTHRVAETASRASWFWPTSAWFSRTWRIFSSPWDSKLTPDGRGLLWNGHRKPFWTLTFGLERRKSSRDRLKRDVNELRLDFSELKGYFAGPGTLN